MSIFGALEPVPAEVEQKPDRNEPTFPVGIIIDKKCLVADADGYLWLVDPSNGSLIEVMADFSPDLDPPK
jgi:hypothetical protein